MRNLNKLVISALLAAVAVVGNAQTFTWLRDGIGRNQEFVQQGGAMSKYSYFFNDTSYAKTWIDGTSWTLESGGLIEAVIAIRPGTDTPPPPSQRNYYVHTALSLTDATWDNLAQEITLGPVLSEQRLPWQTIEGYDQFLVQWNNPIAIENKWISVVEDQPGGSILGRSRVVQGTSSLYASDVFTNSTNQGSSEAFPQANLAFANQPVPEPATLCIFGVGLIGILRRRRTQP